MTVRTTIKIDGDSSDAVAAVNGVSTAFRAASPPVESFTRGALKMTAGVLGAESAVAGLRLVVHSLGESVRAYAESNDAAGEAFSILGGSFRNHFGNAVSFRLQRFLLLFERFFFGV